jgi:divalent metal cation (Fe/Co/Zn/Cd) transporter
VPGGKGLRPVSADSSTDAVGTRQWRDYAPVSWHAIAAVVSITTGVLAHSIVLTGFGLSSVVQTAITSLVLWRLHLQAKGQMGKEELAAERKFLFILGVSFFLLSLYILHEAGSKLFYREKPQISKFGLAFSVLACFAVMALSAMKLGSVQGLRNKVLRAAARKNARGIYPALLLFFGLFLNMRHGWWWADPLAALLSLPFILRQGWKAVEESKETALPRPTTKVI